MLRDDSRRLAEFYAAAHDRIVRTLAEGQGTLHSRKRARQMLREINNTISKLDSQTKNFLKKKIPEHYNRFAKEALKEAAKVKDNVKFGQIHKEAVKAFTDETAGRFAVGLTATSRAAQSIISETLRNNLTRDIAVSKIMGDSLDDASKQIVNRIKDAGITGLVDKKGRQLNIAKYARTLAHTQLAEAGRQGVKNVAIENEFDLVKISSHNSKDQCINWEGKVLSLTGATAGYQTIDEAKAIHLFHPNCQHTYTIIDPDEVTDDMKDI